MAQFSFLPAMELLTYSFQHKEKRREKRKDQQQDGVRVDKPSHNILVRPVLYHSAC